ncbi:CHAT domain-containing protein [Streptomyces sp. NPDC002012]|uniref:CHAT domain-containing tetratricopeptide repeat protein n=1 Tax=Streptomyces sp. NPDC002012 TaxID=3154532 RepID=UPI00332747F9
MTLEEAKQRALGLLVEYERAQDPHTLLRAVTAYRYLRAAVPGQDPDRANCLSHLGIALLRLSELNDDDVTVLQEAARACQEAASLARPGRPEYPAQQFNAAQLLTRLFELTADPALLPEAAQAARNALSAVATDAPDRADMLVSLGDTLQLAYEWLGLLSDLRLAVTALRAALSAYPPGSRSRAGCHVRLCVALRLVYQRTDDLGALRESVEAGRQAVRATPVDDPNHAAIRVNLGNALRALYERSPDAKVLHEALEISRNAVAAFPPGHAARAIVLNVLALTLKLEYERTGELPFLRQAVEASRDAVDAVQPPSLHLATYKMNLASRLRMLADRLHDRAMAHEAVLMGREALEAFAPDDPERAQAQSTLSQALVVLAGIQGDDLEPMLEAVRATDEAHDATPYDHPAYVERLTSHISALMALYRRTDAREYLVRAVHAASNAAASTPPDHPTRGLVLQNLSHVLEKAAQAGVPGVDLTQAERYARDAVEAIAPGHPQRAPLLSNLGDILALLAERTGAPATARECVGVYSAAARMTVAPPAARIRAAQRAARSALLVGHRHQAMALAETGVELVPQMMVRDVERASRESRLRAVYGLAATAAAAAISVGRFDRAVELLEQTRGLVLASTLETRSDLTQLRALAPDLAAPFDELRRSVNTLDHESAALENTLPTVELSARIRELAAQRERHNQDWDRLLERIRQRDGLTRFLKPPPIEELCRQAAHGPIVYLTVHEQQGHALIVRDDPGNPVHALALPPSATTSAVTEHVSTFRAARSTAADQSRPARERRAAQQRMLEILGWIWDNITEPVLRHLGHTTAPPAHEPWPRIWWCPVGPLALLPLHAAGHHTAGSRADSVMDQVISSYTPSIRALAHVRERPSAASSSTLVVAVPDAPECPPLDSAALEAQAVRALVPGAAVLPPPGAATDRDSVIEALRRHDIAHLICHGVADWTDPARSRLILHDHLTHPLTLHTITRLHLESAQLAYLSACSTTDGGPGDESTQLTAAFQLAGYRNVIGTLWPISDQSAATVAHDVYAALTADGTRPPTLDMAAEALHRATRNQRARTPALPSRWAAYIHYGV